MEKKSKKGISRRDFLKAAGVAGAAITLEEFLKAPYVAYAAPPPILLGNIEPLSGPYADSGKDEYQGAKLANDEYNAKGGVLGREIKMISEDAPSNPGIGVQKAKKLVERDKVDFLTGTLTSSVTIAIADYAWSQRKLFVAFGSHSDDTTMQKSHRTTFRTTIQNWALSTACATWIAKNWNVRKIYHITADYTWGHTARESMNRQILKKFGGTELGNDFTPLGTSDFSAQLLKARGLKPDCLIVNCYGADQVNCVKQFKEFGLEKEMRLAGPLSGTPMMKGIGKSAAGAWGLSWHGTVDTPGSKKLYGALMKAYQASAEWRPSYRHYMGYISHTQLFEAIKRAGTTDIIPVTKAFEGHKFESLKWNPSFWRAFDHQNVQDVIIGLAKRDENWKSEDDYFQILGHMNGEEAFPTYEEWKANGGKELEPYDMLLKKG
jgi:branched-chain amino acid transport system substrate-binding protein